LLLQGGFPLDAHPLKGSGFTKEEFVLEGPGGIRAHPSCAVLLQEDMVYSASSVAHGNPALRSHPVLIKVVESLGIRANDDCASLAIEEVADSLPYRISEFAGRESVQFPSLDDYVVGFVMDEAQLPLPDSTISFFKEDH
jgi:hypothetical protein